MKACVIGGTGHIGTNLAPMLVDAGFKVTVVTRGRTPIPTVGAWSRVTCVRGVYERGVASWGRVLEEVGAELVIDILARDVPSTYEAAKGKCRHFIACGSLWMYGEPKVVPTPEKTQGPCPFEAYAERYRELLETRKSAARDGVAFTAIMPPNICGPGKVPLEGLGGRSVEVHRSHQRGDPVPLPEPGQTLIGPCHAEDVAQGFLLAAQQPEAADGGIYNVGARYALTAIEFMETYGRIYGTDIPIEWHSWQDYETKVSPDPGANYHFRAHMCPDIRKIAAHLGYAPRYTPEEAMEAAVSWMKSEELL